MNTITITLSGVDYKIKQSIGTLMLFEEMTGKFVSQLNESVTDIMKLLYCMLKGNNKETFTYSFDEFVDIIDESSDVFEQFTDFLTDVAKEQPTQKKKG